MALPVDEVSSSASIRESAKPQANGDAGKTERAFKAELERHDERAGVPLNAASAQKADAAPGDGKPEKAPQTCTTKAKPGDTFWGYAQQYHTSTQDMMALNPDTKPRRIQIGQTINLPPQACQAQPAPQSGPVANGNQAPVQRGGATNGVTPGTAQTQPQQPLQPANPVDVAAQNVVQAQTSLDELRQSAAKGDGAARAELRDGYADQNLADAKAKLKTAVDDEITAKAGANASDTAFSQAAQDIAGRYSKDPKAAAAVNEAVTQVRTDRQVRTIVSAAQAETDPAKALQTLNAGLQNAPQNVKDAVFSDPNAKGIISNAAAWANEPLAKPMNGAMTPQAQTNQAIQRLDTITKGLDKALAGAVVDQAMPGYEKFVADNQNYIGGSPFGSMGMTTLMNVSGRIAGTPQGNDAVSRFAAMQAWNGDSIRNAIADGADPAYAIEFARQLKASGTDPRIVVETINDGIAMRDRQKIADGGDITQTVDVAKRMDAAGLDSSGVLKVATDGANAFKDKVAADVKKLAEHDAELAWLVQNVGPGLTPQQLSQAVADYCKGKGPEWQAEDTRLRQQIADDGTKLLNQMVALNQGAPSGSRSAVEATLGAIANDPAAELAISTALQTNPNLADINKAKNFADVFSLSKVGDVGRKYANEFASAIVRKNVLSKLVDVDLKNPASVAAAKSAIGELRNENFARLIGVTKSDLDKAITEIQNTADEIAKSNSEDEINAALSRLDSKLNNDAGLSKAFNKSTVPGQIARAFGVAFAGASLLNSYNKYSADHDPQNFIKLMVDAAGFAQKNSEILVGMGAVSKTSAIGQFGGEWKLLGRATAGDLIAGISVVLDGISAVRSGFGIGTKQDTGNAVFSGITATGGALTLAPVFGASAWLGPVGLGVTAVGVVGKMAYESYKDAHKFEGASKEFLIAAGYAAAAADALGKQGGMISGASGASQMPFLLKYAAYKHMSTDQMLNWVNSLTPAQVQDLSKRLLQTAGDSQGDPAQFTDGPPQTTFIPNYGGGMPAQITLANTVGVFEQYLNYDHVPHP